MPYQKFLTCGALVAVCIGASVQAQESPYCRRVRAQAGADAAVLRAPRLFLEGIRFPSSNRLDLGPTVGNNFQARFGLAFSPLDWLRGGLMSDAADADCALHETSSRVDDLLPSIDDGLRARALRGQAAYLTTHRAAWQALVQQASKRFEARLITRVELHQVRALADSLERKLVQVRNEARRLDNGDAVEPPASLRGMAGEYLAKAAALDESVAKLRGLDAWSFKVSGGIIPLPGQPVDWFGIAEVAYSLGGPIHSHEYARAVAAHGEELREGRRELPARLERARREVLARIAATKEELTVIEEQLAVAAEEGRALEDADAPGIDQAREALTMERFSVESEQAFLAALLERLLALTGSDNDS